MSNFCYQSPSGCKCSCQDSNFMLLGNNNSDKRNNGCSPFIDYDRDGCGEGLVSVIELRRKLHKSRGENISLQQELTRIKRVITELQRQNDQLRNQLQSNIQQHSQLHTQQTQSQQYSVFLQQKLTKLQQQLQQQQLTIENNNRFAYNLNQQNELLIGIKNVLSGENEKLRENYREVLLRYQHKQGEIDKLTREIEMLCKDIVRLEHMLSSKNLSLLNYQQIISQRKEKHYLQQQLSQYSIQQQVNKKLYKYKQKALKYKHQRDQLLRQIEQAKQQIGNITLRKYQLQS